MRLIAISSAALLSLLVSARADVIPPCATPSGVNSVPLPDGVPSAVNRALQAKLGKIALPGQEFDATDVVGTGISRRFIFAWNSGSKWLVATEHGGRGYNDPIFLFDLSQNGEDVSLLKTQISFPKGVCSAASAMILG